MSEDTLPITGLITQPIAKKKLGGLKKVFVILSIVSLIVSGFIAAIAIMAGAGDMWQAASTSLVVFAANILILLSLSASHYWLKLVQWLAIAFITINQILVIWISDAFPERVCTEPTVGNNGDYDYSNITCSVSFLNIYEVLINSFWLIIVTLAALALFSKAWSSIKDFKGVRIAYVFTFILALIASILLYIYIAYSDIQYYSDSNDTLALFSSGVYILAFTAAIIVIIFSQIEKNNFKSSEKERLLESQQKILQDYESLKESKINTISEKHVKEIDFNSEAFQASLRFELQESLKTYFASSEFKDVLKKAIEEENSKNTEV